jgi:hypothetical protein
MVVEGKEEAGSKEERAYESASNQHASTLHRQDGRTRGYREIYRPCTGNQARTGSHQGRVCWSKLVRSVQALLPSRFRRFDDSLTPTSSYLTGRVSSIDTYFRSGLYPVQFPFVLGQEAAGEVVEISPSTDGSHSSSSNVKKGDKVTAYISHSYAEYAVAEIDKIFVRLLSFL